jgi:hypothetical protein
MGITSMCRRCDEKGYRTKEEEASAEAEHAAWVAEQMAADAKRAPKAMPLTRGEKLGQPLIEKERSKLTTFYDAVDSGKWPKPE